MRTIQFFFIVILISIADRKNYVCDTLIKYEHHLSKYPYFVIGSKTRNYERIQ